MTVTTSRGRTLIIPAHHTVFRPAARHRTGDRVDPATADVAPGRASRLRAGDRIVVDGTVEVVAVVAAPPTPKNRFLAS